MNDNWQNGCKVFASITKFGETKFKPIRKQENSIKSLNPTKKTKIEESPAPVKTKSVNKFFKSRNTAVLEETNKTKTVPAFITPIKNETKFKQEKPLKLKIKKEKAEKIEKIEKVTKQPKIIKQSTVTIQNTAPSRYSTRSRRNDLVIEKNNSEPTKPVNENKITRNYTNKAKKEKFLRQTTNENINVNEKISINEIKDNDDDVLNKPDLEEKEINLNDNKIDLDHNLYENNIDLDDNNLDENKIELDENNLDDMKINFIQEEKEIKYGKSDFVSFFNKKDEIKSSNETNLNSNLTKDSPIKQNSNYSTQTSNYSTQTSNYSTQNSNETSVDKTEEENYFSSSQATENFSQQSTSSVNSTKTALPQKKRFFSKTVKDKKAQYNAKNFFSNSDVQFENNEFDLESDVNKNSKPVDMKFEFDSDKLKKVKEAHKCAELGEAEHFDGEINFYLSGIKDKNTNSMRCLSILGLANQCLNKPELRMHLRAHDYMGKIICALMDSPKNPNLALCAACLMFVYNQDRLTMDIDPNALSLMLELLECKTDQEEDLVEKKHREKITEMCKTMKTRGHGKYLKLNEINPGTLALESLLSLASKRAGDWFKDELRTLNGIDFLIDTVLKTSESNNNEYLNQESDLNKIDRSLRVIENVTIGHNENQVYVVNYNESLFVVRCIKIYELCKNEIISNGSSNHFLSPLLTILRLFTNLTSDSQEACCKVGESVPEIFDIFLTSVFELPTFVVPDSRFDLIIFLLCLCLNLIESCKEIHFNFINNNSQVKRLIVMLEERCDEAKKTEQQADDFLDSEETQRQLNAETINIDTILTDLVAKSGKHMEHTIIAACISLLIGSGLKDNFDKVENVKKLLPGNNFSMLVDVITKLKEFSNLASIMTKNGIKRVESILSVLKSF